MAQPCPDHDYLGNYPDEWPGAYASEAQGIAHDDGHWFIAQKNALWKIPVESDLAPVGLLNIPGVGAVEVPLLPEGAVKVDLSRDLDAMMQAHAPDKIHAHYDHFGDPDQLGGYLFVPIEGSDFTVLVPTGIPGQLEEMLVETAPPPIVGVYAASDLSFVGSAILTANQARGRNAAWIATRWVGAEFKLYSSYSRISTTEPIFEYDVSPAALAAADFPNLFTSTTDIFLQNTPTLDTIQGGVFSPYGDLYLVNGGATDEIDEDNGGIHVFRPDGSLIVESVSESGLGGFKYEYHPTCCRYEEPEGIDWWDRSVGPVSPGIGGQLHVMLLDNADGGLESEAIYIKHYDVFYHCKQGFDSDSDGLNDYDEVETHSTNPYSADTDGDGLTDGEEVNTWNTNPLADADGDGDGLSDAEEVILHGTNPTASDTDSDGLLDGQEVSSWGTDPLLADTDGDGLNDGQEVLAWATDPRDQDTDDDGLTDGSEVQDHGTDPLNSDTDSDGLGDGLEVSLGVTDPLNTDTDGDGLSDGRDFEFISELVRRVPDEAWKDRGEGLREATEAALRIIEAQLIRGVPSVGQSIRRLQFRFDGCGPQPGEDDWVTDCGEQLLIRAALERIAQE